MNLILSHPLFVDCVLSNKVSLDEHVMCIFYNRLKLYYSCRMCPRVKHLIGNVCVRKRERESERVKLQKKKECGFVYFAIFGKENTFNVVGKF